MRVPYKDPEPIHTPAPLPERIQTKLDRKFWKARGKTLEQAEADSEALKTKYLPTKIETPCQK